MIFFWVGIICTYLLALFSLPRLRDSLEPHIWRSFRTVAVEYIALVFAYDFTIGPLQASGRVPPSYLPFAFMLIGGTSLRIAAFTLRPRAQANARLTANSVSDLRQNKRVVR